MSSSIAGGAANAIGDIAKAVIENTGITKTEQSSTSATDQLVGNLLNQQSTAQTEQTGTVTTQQLGEQQTLNLEALLAQASGLIQGLDPTAAREAAIAETLKSGIGSVIESGQNQGAFDSTAQATAATRLAGEAATQGAAQELSASLSQQQNMAQLAASLNEILKGGTVTATSAQTGKETTAGTQDSTQTTTGTTTETANQTVSEELTPQIDIIKQALGGMGFGTDGSEDSDKDLIGDLLNPFPKDPVDQIEDIKDKFDIDSPF